MTRFLSPLAALVLCALAASATAQQGGAPGKPPAKPPVKAPAKTPPAKTAPAKAAPPKATPAARAAAAETFPFDESQPLLGQWTGMVPVATDTLAFCALRITVGADGKLAGQVLHVNGSVPCQKFEVIDRKVSLSVPMGQRQLALVAEVSADGQTLAGKGTVIDRSKDAKGTTGQPFALSLKREPRAAALAGTRAWSGTIDIPGKGEVPFALVLGATPGGRLVGEVDIPALKLLEAPLAEVKRTDKQLSATWPAQPPVVLDLTFSEDASTLEGVAKLPGATNAVKLKADEALLAERVAALAPPPPAGDPK